MSLIFLIIGTITSILFSIMLFKGSKYDYMIEPLSSDDFPIKTIYSAGLALQDTKVARLKGKSGEILRNDATLLYSRQYGEYYARIVWAQVLSYGLLCISVFFVLAGLSEGDAILFYAMVGIIVTAVMFYYFFTSMHEKISKRQSECEIEFSNAISKLALLVNSGLILHEAWKVVAYGKDGVIYDLMKASCVEMENGKGDVDAIYDFGVMTNSDDIKKFTSALIQSIERGGGELPTFLATQSSELWGRKKQLMLQKGEKAASALLMPIAMMFAGVMLIVLVAALQSFSL